jgi:fructose-1,6-bisphosphatase/inositol monophosphatase family enzyme
MTAPLPMPITAPLSKAQRTQLMNLVRRAARAEIMPRFRQLDPHQISAKAHAQDLVTDADKGAEAMIARGLQTMFPHALIVGEEAVADNPSITDKIGEAELCFTIDPVDGTWNYAKGLTTFGVIISILRFGIPVFGLLYDPVMNDFIIADEQSPAEYIGPRLRRRRLQTSQGGKLEDLIGYVPLFLLPKDKQAQMAATYPQFGRVNSLRCSCHETRMLTSGGVDFVLSARVTPWDHSAGVVTVTQAGGYCAMLDGSDFRGDMKSGYLLCAGSKDTWEQVREVFAFLDETSETTETEGTEPETSASETA